MGTVSLVLRLAIQQGQFEEDNWHFATRVLCNNGTRENSRTTLGTSKSPSRLKGIKMEIN